MAQFYTLEEAARVLGMGPDELKGKAQHREVRAFLDGGSWRFRVADVDELARRRGLGSDADLQLSDLEIPSAAGDKDLDLSEFQMGAAAADLGQPTMEVPARDYGDSAGGSGSDHDILLDDLSLPPGPITGSSSVIIGMGEVGKLSTDSDVRLVPDNPKGASDSDVRLATPFDRKRPAEPDVRPPAPREYKAPTDSDVTLIADDTSHHEAYGSGSSDVHASLPSRLGSSGETPSLQGDSNVIESNSDFELTPSGVLDALQPESGSDFELSALDASDEFEATPLHKPGDSDVTAAEPGLSGINLSRPSDSGINLQMAAGLGAMAGGGEGIELAPLSGDDIPTAPKAKAKPAPAAAAKPKKADLAATLHPGSVKSPKADLAATIQPGTMKADPSATVQPGSIKEKDIFDDTDFEVDALAADDESDDKTMQLDAASDFDLEEADTGSEVFAIDEEDVDQNAATSIGSAAVLDDEEEDDGFAAATSGEMTAGAWDVESEGAPATASGRVPASPLAASGPGPEWGGLWVGMLGVTTLFMLFLAFVSMDLVRNLYSYQQDSPASGIVKSLAGLIGG